MPGEQRASSKRGGNDEEVAPCASHLSLGPYLSCVSLSGTIEFRDSPSLAAIVNKGVRSLRLGYRQSSKMTVPVELLSFSQSTKNNFIV